MSDLRDRMTRELQLRRYSAQTQKTYLEAVKGLTKHFWIRPDQLTAEQVQDYVLHLFREGRLQWNSINSIVSGLKFFYAQTLKRADVALAIPPRRTPRHLPEIYSAEELVSLFAAANNAKHRALLMTTYGGGLRVSEVVRLQLTDIDSQRRMIRVTEGKGKKDRYTLLSERLLTELRAYWQLDRPRPWLFPGQKRGEPMTADTARAIFKQAKARAKIQKKGSIHVLRHCFGTHLLEAGVDLRTIQILMGHASIRSTVWYLHLTRKTLDKTQNPLDLLDLSKLPRLTGGSR
jgi:integrase/recombinase XerD